MIPIDQMDRLEAGAKGARFKESIVFETGGHNDNWASGYRPMQGRKGEYHQGNMP